MNESFLKQIAGSWGEVLRKYAQESDDWFNFR